MKHRKKRFRLFDALLKDLVESVPEPRTDDGKTTDTIEGIIILCYPESIFPIIQP